jgi:GDP-L-fucose synthase
MKEEYLLSGKLEPTNEFYALAKISGLKLLESYKTQYNFESISLMPCNLYGTNDNFNPEHSHVLSSLVRKFVDAVNQQNHDVEIWGSGIARREFMHVDDIAEAVLYFLSNPISNNFINIGWGLDISIKELADLIATETSYKGEIVWNTEMPNGMLRKCMDITKMKEYNFQPKIDLKTGIKQTILEYKQLKNYL